MKSRSLIILAAIAGLAAGGAYAWLDEEELPKSENLQAAPEAVKADDCAGQADAAKALLVSAKGEVAALLPASPPQSLSQLEFTGPDGAPMLLGGLKGKLLLVNLWATWCVPCREEMPALDALQKAKGGADFEVVAINTDRGGGDKPKAFLAEVGAAALAQYSDPKLAAFNDLKGRGLVLGLPATMLVGKDGCLLAHMNGPAEWASPDALSFIDAARKL